MTNTNHELDTMSPRRVFPDDGSKNVPPNARMREMGKRIQALALDRGWTQAELARQASRHVPGKKIARDMINGYWRGLVWPGPVYRRAIAKAFGVEEKDIFAAPPIDKAPMLNMQQTEDGLVWLQVNMAMDMATALEVMEILRRAGVIPKRKLEREE